MSMSTFSVPPSNSTSFSEFSEDFSELSAETKASNQVKRRRE